MVSRKGSQAPTPPLSVKGIGNKGGFLFFSEVVWPAGSVDLTLCLSWCYSGETGLLGIQDRCRDGEFRHTYPYSFGISTDPCCVRSAFLREVNHI